MATEQLALLGTPVEEQPVSETAAPTARVQVLQPAEAGGASPAAAKNTGGRVLAPMLQQYLDTKRSYPEHLLLFQVGDFFEVFFDDAKVVSEELSIRLTSRDKEQENPIPMCGVPIHALDNYLPKLLQRGYSCVIVSQVEDARQKKGMVRREITRIVTPGVRFEGDGLDAKQFNYLAAAFMLAGAESGALAYADVSTGALRVQEVENSEELVELIRKVQPAELLLPTTISGVALDKRERWVRQITSLTGELGFKLAYRPFAQPNRRQLTERLAERLASASARERSEKEVAALPPAACATLDAVLSYVEEVSFGSVPLLAELQVEQPSQTVFIDAATRRHLELVESRFDGERRSSLLSHIDYTKTAMGSRLLAGWITAPSTDVAEIGLRHDAVEEFGERNGEREELRECFTRIRDLDRLVSRLTGFRATPRDLGSLADSLTVFPRIEEIVQNCSSQLLQDLGAEFDALGDIAERLAAALNDDLPMRFNEGGIFKPGYNEEVDRLRTLRDEGHLWLADLEAKERQRTGISGLKIRYNNVFGYFIEVSKAHIAKAPQEYERRQTLANAERFITPELKEFESSILSAKSRQIELERELFLELRGWLQEQAGRIQQSSRALALLDVCTALAHLAQRHAYTRPAIAEGAELRILGGRHPVVEQVVGAHNFVPNDTYLNGDTRRFAVLTGPNMGGKSTYLRQVGLIQILAQAGSFVPAQSAELGVVDRIFTRIGAADDLARGDSTFMVEMREAAAIVRKAGRRSLVLIDEIGRGTATADGLAIATAICEWLLETSCCRTIFATHFHELTRLPNECAAAFCLAVGVIEHEKELTFTHRIEEKAADRSYGIEVARLAGLPERLLERAQQLLLQQPASGETPAVLPPPAPRAPEPRPEAESSKGREIERRLRGLNPNTMTPLEALQQLFELKELSSE